MIRNLILLIFIAIALAMLRALVMNVSRAVNRSWNKNSSSGAGFRAGGSPNRSGKARQGGRLVRDPVSGIYVDEQVAIKEEVGGKVYYFESRQNRDAFLASQRT